MDEKKRFDWNPIKNDANVRSHRIDFADVHEVFEGPHLIRGSSRKGEHRQLAIGYLGGREVTVIFARRGDVRWIISARRARVDEREAFQDAVHRLRPKS